METDTKQNNILLKNSEYIKMLIGLFFAHFADSITQIALIAWVVSSISVAGQAIATAFFLFLLPQFLLSPFISTISDKFDRKIIMILSNLYRFGIIIIIASIMKFVDFTQFSQSRALLIIYVFAFLLGAGYTLFYSAKMAFFRNIMTTEYLKTANTISSGMINFVNIFGVAVAGVILTKIGLFNLILLVGIFYFAASACFSLIKIIYPQKYSVKNRVIRDIKIAINYISAHKTVLRLLAISFLAAIILGIFFNELNTLTVDYLKLGVTGVTEFRVMHGIGILAGMVVMLIFSKSKKINQFLIAGFFTMGLTLYTSYLCDTKLQAWFWLVPFGIANVLILVLLDTYLQKCTPDRIRGKIFGIQLTINTLAYLIGAYIVLSTNTEPFLMYKILGAASCIIGIGFIIRR